MTPAIQTFDIIILCVLIGGTVRGFCSGMLRQVTSLAAIVASYFAAMQFSGPLAHLFGTQAPLNRIVAMLAIYVITSLGVWLLFRPLRAFFDRLQLQGFDRQIGGLLGAAKGVLLCLAITFFSLSLVPESRDPILHSRSGHYLAVLIDRGDRILPAELRQILAPYLNKLQSDLAPAAVNSELGML